MALGASCDLRLGTWDTVLVTEGTEMGSLTTPGGSRGLWNSRISGQMTGLGRSSEMGAG